MTGDCSSVSVGLETLCYYCFLLNQTTFTKQNLMKSLGDQKCDLHLNNEVCCFDGGDCADNVFVQVPKHQQQPQSCNVTASIDWICDVSVMSNQFCEQELDCLASIVCSSCKNHSLSSKIGDQLCQEQANTVECCYDLLDCHFQDLDLKSDILGCSTCDADLTSFANYIGDFHCDEALFTPQCCLDGGDCLSSSVRDLCSSCEVEKSIEKIGDGVCQPFFLTPQCCFDSGDCLVEDHSSSKYCITCLAKHEHFDKYIGNGICEKRFNVPECCLDGGDCIPPIEESICPTCIEKHRRFNNYIANDKCEHIFDTLECCFDAGSCLLSTCLSCKSPAVLHKINDNFCDKDIAHRDCCYDGGDCNMEVILATTKGGCKGCPVTDGILFLADGRCNDFMNTPNCCFDGGDCDVLELMDCHHCVDFKEHLIHVGDFVCDLKPSQSMPCCYDGNDCHSLPRTPMSYLYVCEEHCHTKDFRPRDFTFTIGDGICQPELNNANCCFDGFDCNEVLHKCKSLCEHSVL